MFKDSDPWVTKDSDLTLRSDDQLQLHSWDASSKCGSPPSESDG
jgi:hypothetical protein